MGVVVVGAGLAGAQVAVALREGGHRGRIQLLGDEPTLPFGRPPLSKTYLLGTEAVSDWYVRPPHWYEENEIDFAPDAAMSRVDTDARQVILANGEAVGYDRLVLCTGGRARKPPIAGADLPGVHVLRTVADCDAIKSAACPGARAVVVGSGFIGCEVAAALRQLGVDVTMVVSGAAPLAAVLGEPVGTVLGGIHGDHGVRMVGDERVIGFAGSDRLESVVTSAGTRIDCDFAVVGVGIEPNLATVAGTAIACDNGVLVDGRGRTNVDGIYAAGDVANHLHPLFGRVRVEHYNNAEKMGQAVARSMLGDESPYAYVHSFWSDQYEHKLEYVGHAATSDRLVVRGSLRERSFLGFYLRGGVLRAAVGLNRGGDPELDGQGDLQACQQLIAHQAAVSAGDLEDERVDLHSLLTTS